MKLGATTSPVPTAAWLDHHCDDLVEVATGSVHPEGGFAWLDDHGSARLDRDVETWICARMTHVFALASMRGDESATALLDHGVRALFGRLRDAEHGGWFTAVNADGPTVPDKRAYEHAFVILAGASARAAGHPRGAELLDEALGTFETRFWDEEKGLAVDVWDRTWRELEDYRGVNANMHTVEAFLAAAEVTGDRRWTARAARIVEQVVHGFAATNGYRLPEHFTADWSTRFDYNREAPAHPFRPYGVTVGHLLEWSRLTLQTRLALEAGAPAWMLEDARALFEVAVADGWSVDGAEGFVYTTDFEGRPVVRDRLHWVVTEGIAAAWTLYETTGDERYAELYRLWWDHAQRLFIDQSGSWRHELDPHNKPAATVWDGRPDVYHAYQAALLPRLGPCASFVGGLAVLTGGGSFSGRAG